MAFDASIDGKDASNKLPYFPPDFSGVVVVDCCKEVCSRKGELAFVVEFSVESSNLEAARNGGHFSWYQSLREPDTAFGSILSFLYAALGVNPNNDKAKIDAKIKPFQSKFLNDACSAQNTLKGARLHLGTRTIITKEKKQNFTLHTFAVAPALPAAKA